MKIAFLINSLTSGGAEKIVVTIIDELKKENTNIELICLEKNNFYDLPNNIKVTYLTDNSKKSSGIRKLLELPFLSLKLKEHVKENNIQIIQSHLYRANYINVLSNLFGSKHKSQIVNHGIASRYKKKGLLGKINLFLIQNLYTKADKVITISKEMKNDLNNLFKFNNTQLVINNPYDLRSINILKDQEITEFVFDSQKKYLITMGRLINLKRYSDVIKSLKDLNESIELILLGDGEEKENLKILTNDLNLEKRIHFIGNVQNPFKYLSKSDIFILSSETEGFPNSLIEALACGLTVISSDCISGPREILAPNTNSSILSKNKFEIHEYGILYPTGDIEELSNSILYLFENINFKLELEKKSIIRANDFSVERIITQYKKVLELE
ncbi:MAG: glycosyltransferase [Aliarcobacter sp.]|jgi:N-acetylgalactosamine-N,N'-diacetylbacillosaminyl-diphospho-undecaprenol 4-alpha-N-acetylgalactosaminyltransferase|nr:glycosyltransferase [Aliarcobacter sp.]